MRTTKFLNFITTAYVRCEFGCHEVPKLILFEKPSNIIEIELRVLEPSGLITVAEAIISGVNTVF